MPASLTAAKICVCGAAGALIGGAAVHVVEKPKRAAVRQVSKLRPAVRRAAVPAAPVPPPPCLPMMTPALAVRTPAAVFGPDRIEQRGPVALASSAPSILPIGTLVPIGQASGTAPAGEVRSQPVTEPAALSILALGMTVLALMRRKRER
jgi:hypothetical protein